MTVYELIKELFKHEPNKEVVFHLNAEFYASGEPVNYQVDVDLESIDERKKYIQLNFTN